MYNVPRRAFMAMSCLLAYLAALTVRDVLAISGLNEFHGSQMYISIMENLLACPMTILAIMELAHYRQVGLLTASKNLLPFVVLIVLYFLAINYGLWFYQWIFVVFVILLSTHVLYYIVVLRKAADAFETQLHNTYANSEGRTLNWYNPIVVLMLLWILIFSVLCVFFDGNVAILSCNVAALVFWVAIASHVRRMRESSLIPIPEEDEDITVTDDRPEEVVSPQEPEFDAEQLSQFIQKLDSVLDNAELLCREDLSREDVSKAMEINQTLMIRMLKEATGMTFSEYICNRRLAIASKMLVTTSEGIEQILYGCGFRSRATFHRAFTKKYHCSPTDYRRAHIIEE